jgi:cytochrome P450
VLALARAAADPAALASSLAATIGVVPPPRPDAAAAFSRWMLHDLIGGASVPVDATSLADGIAAAEALAETAQVGLPPAPDMQRAGASLARVLTECVDVAHGPFVKELRERAWSTHEIVEELIGLSLAGWESTAAAVTTALTLGLPARTHASDIDELLRLYPPSWLIVRTMTGDEAWGSAGELAVISPWISHRSPAWREPERFDPARMGDPAPFPFGAGPRRCPADLYARTQIAVAVAAFGGREGGSGRPELLGHRSATLIPDNFQRTL